MADAYFFVVDREGMGPVLQFFYDSGSGEPLLVDSWAFHIDGPDSFYDAIADLVDGKVWYEARHAHDLETITTLEKKLAAREALYYDLPND